jgi:gamma-glutamyltranspeptidase / glutathione hydrolase
MNRRALLQLSGAAAASLIPGARVSAAAPSGKVVGHATAAQAGEEVLRTGGNAADAVVTAALVAAVVALGHCGIGGYGGHAVVALPGGKKVTAFDFDGFAPAAATPGMFPLDERGSVRGRINEHGWLAAGVPGTLAGLELVLKRCGTRSFAEALQPAIRFAREGFPLPAGQATAIRGSRAGLLKDAGCARLLLTPDGEAPKEGDLHRNPDLAALLQTLADRGTADSFSRGDLAQRVADAFKTTGGLVTAADLAAYHAVEAEPLRLEWRGSTIYTAPLPAGGASVLQMLRALRELEWEKLPVGSPQALHTLVEAMRVAWQDRLSQLGDPRGGPVPLERLLSRGHAEATAARVREAVQAKQPVPGTAPARDTDGTVHLSAVDSRGMMAALTLTHGGAFGAQVAVEGLGLVLGHGMSRFDPHPGHPNSPGPRKRSLTNMCPGVVLREGQPVLAFGGAGGRRIVSSVLQVLAQAVGRGASLEAALVAPRLHTEGNREVVLDARMPEAALAYLAEVGYQVRRGTPGALVSAVDIR